MGARLALAAIALALSSCGGGGGGSGAAACGSGCVPAAVFLTEADVRRVIAQAVGEAQARGLHAHVAVVDRSGNVLGVFSMTGAPATVAISSGLGVTGGLDGIPAGTVPATLAAITKAITGAYLSSQGNAFSTRTASQIVQEHFNPGESQQPSGPLYGVQFSQLSCSDVNRNTSHGSVGPKRSPLGLAADPGGLPLYKDGVLVGGVGVESNGLYTIDRDIDDVDQDDEELVAVAGAFGFAAPDDIRGNRITADGRSFRYLDSEATRSDPSHPPAFASLPGVLVAVDGYVTAAARDGAVFGLAPSGIVPASASYAGGGAWILVDGADNNRYPFRASTLGDMSAAEVEAIVTQALAVAQRARAQIRRPLGSFAQVTITVVDPQGVILGLARTPDAPVFGIDVAVQKARTAAYFSSGNLATRLGFATPAHHLDGTDVLLQPYGVAMGAFLGDGGPPAATAWSARAVGNIHRPLFPDGIADTRPGPLSTPIERWSPFNVGLQLDLVYNQFIKGILGDTSTGCAGRLRDGPPGGDGFFPQILNGLQIFPGAVPIYRGNALVGAIGISGDGVDQDDMIAFLGLANAARALGTGLGNAPASMRADNLAPRGVRLRYVQCPQSPFNDSAEQNVCAGL